MMKVGIVGMPNAGKSSLFNALSRAGAQAANYPFTTIEPNVAVVGGRGRAAGRGGADVRSSNVVPDTIEFHDIAGLVAGAHKGEGLGNQFLANIRETDALLHVVRAHDDPNVIHPEGRVDPAADMDTIETELIYADLEQAERRHVRVVREARGGDRRGGRGGEVAARGDRGAAGGPAGALGAGAGGSAERGARPRRADREAGALRGERVARATTTSPRWCASTPPAATPQRSPSPRGSRPSCPSSTTTRRRRCARSSGSPSRACSGSCSGAFWLLDLIAFFTAGEDKPAQSWHLRRGLSAWHAAGEIHSDIQRGFVRAEVIGWDALVEAGGYAPARERGVLRLEGRDYAMQDGDVITVKFTP